jgi:nucleoside phosphorylase
VRQTEAFRVDPFDFKEWKFQANKSAIEQASKLNDKKGKPARDELGRHQPEIHFGTVASGSLVIADKKKRAELLRLHGKIIATEMEGAGVLHATFRQEMPTPAIVIKGISDAADLNKSVMDAKKYWRVLAAENSVRVAFQLITRGADSASIHGSILNRHNPWIPCGSDVIDRGGNYTGTFSMCIPSSSSSARPSH